MTSVIAPISRRANDGESHPGGLAGVEWALQNFDPERNALVVDDGSSAGSALPGRTVLSGGSSSRARLERKLSGERILAAVSDRSDLVRFVDLTGTDAYRTCQEVDLGDGVVLASDPPHWPGAGGSHVRWVAKPSDFEAAARDLGVGTVARAMPYLRGIPASMHGLVLADGILTCPPMQLMNLVLPPRPPNESRSFFGAGAATLTHVDAPAADRMRAIVLGVGQRLNEISDYRGLYCVDGILTADDFVPTEINMREGSSIGVAFSQQPQLPIQLLNAVACSNLVVGESASALAQALAASTPPEAAVTWHTFYRLRTRVGDEVVRNDAEWHSTPRSVGAFVQQLAVTGGSGVRGGQTYVRGTLKGEVPPQPTRLLGLATEFWRSVADELGVDIGRVEPPLT